MSSVYEKAFEKEIVGMKASILRIKEISTTLRDLQDALGEWIEYLQIELDLPPSVEKKENVDLEAVSISGQDRVFLAAHTHSGERWIAENIDSDFLKQGTNTIRIPDAMFSDFLDLFAQTDLETVWETLPNPKEIEKINKNRDSKGGLEF